jgi:hypothetical protein
MKDVDLLRRLQEAARSMEQGEAVHTPDLLREVAERLADLRGGIDAYLAGDYPNPRDHRPHKCQHGTYYYEECGQCDEEHFTRVLAGEGGVSYRKTEFRGPPSSAGRV